MSSASLVFEETKLYTEYIISDSGPGLLNEGTTSCFTPKNR